MTSHPTASATQAERILSFWHKVEFFESAELKGIDHGKGAIHYHSNELLEAPTCLPWLDSEKVRRAGKEYWPGKAYRFKLYLGVFARSEIFRVAREAYPEKTDAWVERSRDEGLTCSMSVAVKEDGCIDPESFEISTAPWMLGALQQGTLDDATLDAFETATELFRERLTTILTVADNLKREHGLPSKLTTFELIELLKAMQRWTAFAPESETPALVVQPFPSTKSATADPAQSADLEWSVLGDLSHRLEAPTPNAATEAEASAESDDATVSINEIAILNSFFIRDLETVMKHMKTQGLAPGSPLACYLAGKRQRHPDLLRPEGRDLLVRTLAPERMPDGRWPDKDEHSMSLMQQFAINTIDDTLAETGLYSVNGPPGTGKTTMLRDLVARNMVKRAEVLASLSSPEAAFGEDLHASIDGDTLIKTLIPELTGFEMVVASSNNAAVENVTRELPQTKALGEAYRDLAFLKPVGQKLAAPHTQTSATEVHVKTLPPEKDCWGLIATSLGKKRNRSTFGERVFFKKIDQCVAEGEAADYSTLVPMLKARAEGRDTQQDFRAAQRAFQEASKGVQAIQADLERLQALHRLEAETKAAQRQTLCQKGIAARLSLWLSNQQAKHVPFWPLNGYFANRVRIKQIKQRVQRAERQLAVSQQRLDALERRLEKEHRECAPLKEQYRDVRLADDTLDLEAPDVQRTSFGHGHVLNQARSQLTARAFELHEAWLVAAYEGGNKLWPTLKALMPVLNGGVQDREAAKAVWQMLFMIVPVVSSTFASVANQFKALKEGEIGWLFIDEAGQATPQQAVGALWRAKRAVVVGDPLQIEPVFTVPAGLVEAMAKGEFDRDWYQWSPTVSSVQVVADRANPYGTNEISEAFWVGSPLRVHRRCDEPMFSIANRIAYNDKMLHGSDTLPPGPGDSRWFDVEGDLDGKHFVPAQAERVARMLSRHIKDKHELPSVYIISPFKAVAQGLQDHLAKHLDADAFGGRDALREWLKERVGTVHTFQGKEEDNVIMVLGLSAEDPGAADWASSKPNLLNVAVTRAKKRVYVVGSTDIWAGKQYFSDAKTLLAQETA